MKVKIDIDCTPAEARAFFGLPDVAPVQEAMIAEMQARMKEQLDNLKDPEAFFKSWAAVSGQGLEQFQKFFSAAMATGGKSAK
ncbi:MAG: DUF6489 family protein [Parvularculaceae bacterium]